MSLEITSTLIEVPAGIVAGTLAGGLVGVLTGVLTSAKGESWPCWLDSTEPGIAGIIIGHHK